MEKGHRELTAFLGSGNPRILISSSIINKYILVWFILYLDRLDATSGGARVGLRNSPEARRQQNQWIRKWLRQIMEWGET